jgi:predicted component of type VI protein secretion system
MTHLTEGMRATLGHVRIRPLRDTALIDATGAHVAYQDVMPPGGIAGRGDDADIRIVDGAGYVSRRHLVIEPQGLQWVIRDLRSAHGTVLHSGGKRVPLAQHVPFPVATGDEVTLALVARIGFQVVAAAPRGIRTKDASPTKSTDYIDDPELSALAYAMLEPRRHLPGSHVVPSVDDLALALGVDPRTIYRRLEKLRAIDKIGRHLPGRRPSPAHIADAIAVAYPYLAVPERSG